MVSDSYERCSRGSFAGNGPDEVRTYRKFHDRQQERSVQPNTIEDRDEDQDSNPETGVADSKQSKKPLAIKIVLSAFYFGLLVYLIWLFCRMA